MKMCEVDELVDKTLSSVVLAKNNEEIVFTTDTGESYRMFHEQDCCEAVSVEDITGELSDLEGSPMLLAEVVTNSDDRMGRESLDDSFTWTFYKFATQKGYVTIRWLGESNGYYSEAVDFCKEGQG